MANFSTMKRAINDRPYNGKDDGMPRYRRTIISGDVIEIEEFTCYAQHAKTYSRGMNLNETDEEKQERNFRDSLKKLARLINCNFRSGDLFITLTHRERVTEAEADKELTNFLRRLKRWRKKNDLPDLKYIARTECDRKREHHHLIVNCMDISLKELTKLWGLGIVLQSELEPGGDYTGLAVYVTKEGTEPQKRRWRASKNLEKPIVKIKKLKADKGRKLYPPKGYQVVESYEYYSAYSGAASYLKAVKIGGSDYGGT